MLMLERSDCVVIVQDVATVDYLDLSDRFVGCGMHPTHPGLDNERFNRKFDAEYGMDIVWVTIFTATVVFVGTAKQYSKMLAVDCLDWLTQHREKDCCCSDAGEDQACGGDGCHKLPHEPRANPVKLLLYCFTSLSSSS